MCQCVSVCVCVCVCVCVHASASSHVCVYVQVASLCICGATDCGASFPGEVELIEHIESRCGRGAETPQDMAAHWQLRIARETVALLGQIGLGGVVKRSRTGS